MAFILTAFMLIAALLLLVRPVASWVGIKARKAKQLACHVFVNTVARLLAADTILTTTTVKTSFKSTRRIGNRRSTTYTITKWKTTTKVKTTSARTTSVPAPCTPRPTDTPNATSTKRATTKDATTSAEPVSSTLKGPASTMQDNPLFSTSVPSSPAEPTEFGRAPKSKIPRAPSVKALSDVDLTSSSSYAGSVQESDVPSPCTRSVMTSTTITPSAPTTTARIPRRSWDATFRDYRTGNGDISTIYWRGGVAFIDEVPFVRCQQPSDAKLSGFRSGSVRFRNFGPGAGDTASIYWRGQVAYINNVMYAPYQQPQQGSWA